eukprot:m.286288 g.286288  ORF g.286288 m.286288 type:complete len:129 (+) comp19437_c2_seq7:255-641(+)
MSLLTLGSKGEHELFELRLGLLLEHDTNALPCLLPPPVLRAVTGYDPASSELHAIKAFAPVLQSTGCLFARSAHLWASADATAPPDTQAVAQKATAEHAAPLLTPSLRALALFASTQDKVDGVALVQR